MKNVSTFEQFFQGRDYIHNIPVSAANALRKVGGPMPLKERIFVVDTSSSMSSTTLCSPEWDLLCAFA